MADLGLDEVEEPTEHVADRVEWWVEQLADVVRQQDPEKVRSTWDKMCRSLFAPKQPFHAVTWDALEAKIPEGVRRRWGLELPRLGRHEAASRSLAFDPADDPAELAGLPEDLQLSVRALGVHASEADVLHVLQRVLQTPGPSGAWTDDELATLLGRARSTIQSYRRQLRLAAAGGTNRAP